MRYVHPDQTDDTTPVEGGPTFTIGYFPPKVSARIDVMRARMRRPDEQMDPVKDYDLLLEQSGISIDAFSEMCRYGVRGWKNFGELKCELETDEDGNKRLSEVCVRALHLNKLAVAVGYKALLYNHLSEEERGKSEWRSAFSTTSPDTNAAGAAPASPANKTEPSPSA